ncbi:hypothetical protein MAR_021695 [Mya arenaria]|uniref:DDE Tnp4 domain-containing protein n=1 Tax=Mya arenaria TaxID=6604 RepID=A0ABY7EGP4_MYAAR|nr:hypothetical protein MAR_021695 [Mya arenaria]
MFYQLGSMPICASREKFDNFIPEWFKELDPTTPGSISDQNITRQCGLISFLDKCDSVMTDKGFIIGKLVARRGAKLNIPPFSTKRDLFGKEDVEEMQIIATCNCWLNITALDSVLLSDFVPWNIDPRNLCMEKPEMIFIYSLSRTEQVY